ncbi:hypothetical protein [Pararobbsia silviterrae]|uniref:Uncharacterized protein n=1 Tax=Pararobbsia silviterrae TaxID=1792498 RepID=A0A494YA03_9BURK|nr:hypothetical protein [Pararobbsia silviterrae]RKP59206.1 hypothetical protein D7S86_04740 [Pararobbsia silviterrae]
MSTTPTPNPTPADPACDDAPADSVAQDASERPHDGDHNQGGARPAGLEYQRELGTEQDA